MWEAGCRAPGRRSAGWKGGGLCHLRLRGFSCCARRESGRSPVSAPPFPPQAERCALMCVLSIICMLSNRPRAASSWNNRSQMPRSAHRTDRLYTVVRGPYSGGQSFQQQPLFSICRMPLRTRRSSARSLPRTSVGRCGSISRHCSSRSQYRFDRIFSAPFTAENQQPIPQAADLLDSRPSLRQ